MASAMKATKATDATTAMRAPGLETRVAELAIRLLGEDEAKREARAVLERAAAMTSPAGDVRRAREAIEARVRAAARLALVEGLIAGAPPAWSGAPDRAEVAAGVLRWWQEHNGLAGVTWLVDRLQQYIHADEGELAELRAGLEGATPYHVLDGDRPKTERLLALEDRLAARSSALERFRAEFRARVGAVIKKYRPALESGLYENLALSGAHTAPVEAIGVAERRLAEVKDQVGLLTGSKIAPGPKAALLRKEAAELEARIPKLRAEQSGRVEAEVKALVDRAAAGDLDACRGLAEDIGRSIDSFPPECYRELQAAGAEAMIAADAVTWAGALEASVAGGAGREF